MPRTHYDEFSMFHENATEWALPYSEPPEVVRIEVPVAPSRHVSALRWGRTSPEAVLLHGGAQNAHTFDTLALALKRPLLAPDLPGHGHSDAAPGGLRDVDGHASDVSSMLGALGVAHVPIVGMSLGGLVALSIADLHPALVSRLALIDVTPGVTAEKARNVAQFVHGPATFPDLDELVAHTRSFAPSRSAASIRRGVLHNAIQLDDGTWVWRHQRFEPPASPVELDTSRLWGAVARLSVPLLLVRAMGPGSVVDDDDERELRRARPDVQVVHVEDSGHAVQSDQPLVLASALAAFLDD